ncbi:MAG: GNAT family N-acetyltransferase [Gordonia sp. (in: high G+C Gram-positive bacteria)]|uniref:GNAT family N-acetyltransferase n=1 Tax=Gordonia sp. (in: high G+C Gram-positive bacteria) TaxID=84139 RepID=UPI0039E38CE9
MSMRLIDLPADDAHLWLEPAVHTYVTAMRYPKGTEFNRIGLWRDHLRRPGWRAVGALTTVSAMDLLRPGHARLRVEAPWTLEREVLVGVAYGYTGYPDQWWNRQLRTGLAGRGCSREHIEAVASDYFELTEIHVHPLAQGRGLGQALLTTLLTDRPESRVLLSTPEVPGEENRAWSLYRRLGFGDVLRHFLFAGDPRPFAFLGRDLPLPPTPLPADAAPTLAR